MDVICEGHDGGWRCGIATEHQKIGREVKNES